VHLQYLVGLRFIGAKMGPAIKSNVRSMLPGNRSREQDLQVPEFVTFEVDQLGMAGFEISQHITIFSGLELEIPELGVHVPDLGCLNSGANFVFDVHHTLPTPDTACGPRLITGRRNFFQISELGIFKPI
jgi:hypothetical protein